jgi:hypothetical protein
MGSPLNMRTWSHLNTLCTLMDSEKMQVDQIYSLELNFSTDLALTYSLVHIILAKNNVV